MRKCVIGSVHVAVAAVGIIILTGLNGFAAPFWNTLPQTDAEKPVTLTNVTVANLVDRLKPAVVNISVTQTVKTQGGAEFGFDDFWKRFFDEQEPKEFKRKGLGSGFVISKEGYIVTNNHVIQKANEIIVVLHNKKQYPATIVGSDPKTDIALIKIETEETLTVAPLGDSNKLREGEAVIAIGNPFGLNETVTAGIVSAKGRVIGAGPYDDFIQTDASINPGNSGGPLLNLAGEVVGINTAIAASGQGIGFAVPINMAKEVIGPLREKGKVTRGWIGVSIQEVTPEIAKSFEMKEAFGALVSDVLPDGPAEEAGFRRGDIILEVGGKTVKDYHDLPRIVASMTPGEKASFKVLRDGKEQTITGTVGEMKEGEVAQRGRESGTLLGLSLQTVTPDIAKELGMKKVDGLVVTDIDPGSPAAEGGVQRGDVILEVNRKPVKTVADFSEIAKKDGTSVLLLIYRGGSTFYITLQTTDRK